MVAVRNRHGKHAPGKVMFGGMVTPRFKALAQLTASMSQCSLMELMQRGVYTLATEAGILRDGRVVPEYNPAIAAMADMITSKLYETREGAK